MSIEKPPTVMKNSKINRNLRILKYKMEPIGVKSTTFSAVARAPVGHHLRMKMADFYSNLPIRRPECLEVGPGWCTEPVQHLDQGASRHH
jgi:hypothetical protein